MSASFEEIMQRWALWAEGGMMPYRQQMTHFLKIRSSKGGGSYTPVQDSSIEQLIEIAVSKLAVQSPRQAQVVRAEYSRRHQSKHQIDIALSLDLTLRTYQRALASAKTFIKEDIKWT